MGMLFYCPSTFVDTVRTVSDSKRYFYTQHTRPINSIYRSVVEELMVEMHLLSVNTAFRYDPIYALGIVTTFDRFMTGYTPETDLESIFRALCASVEGNAEQYRQDAQSMSAIASSLTQQQLTEWSSACVSIDAAQPLYETLKAIAFNEAFKYSRLFGIGLYTLLEQSQGDELSAEQMQATLQEVAMTLHIPTEKLRKDLELYQSNLEKLSQAKEALADTLKADRKQRQQREDAKNSSVDEPTESPSTPDDSAAST